MQSKLEIHAYYVPEADYWLALVNHAPRPYLDLSGTGAGPIEAIRALCDAWEMYRSPASCDTIGELI